MAVLTCALFNNKELHINCGIYKARGSIIPRLGEYHFSISEKNEKTNEWTYIATYSDSNYLRLISDICNALVDFQDTAEEIENVHKSPRNKRPIL